MSDLAHLVQDLRAHAHEAPPHLRDMIRRAAAELEQLALDRQLAANGCGADLRPFAGDVQAGPVPIPPPED